ncbi:hypothetical protein [Leucobacter sp. GX24907]
MNEKLRALYSGEGGSALLLGTVALAFPLLALGLRRLGKFVESANMGIADTFFLTPLSIVLSIAFAFLAIRQARRVRFVTDGADQRWLFAIVLAVIGVLVLPVSLLAGW